MSDIQPDLNTNGTGVKPHRAQSGPCEAALQSFIQLHGLWLSPFATGPGSHNREMTATWEIGRAIGPYTVSWR